MIIGYLLTGGKNRRMHGDKKLFLNYEGVSFYEHITAALSDFPEIWLSADKKEPYLTLGHPVVEDEIPECGPLGGILSGLRLCGEDDALFTVACDMPLLKKEHVQKLCRIYAKTPDRIVIAQSGGKLHPLCGIYPHACLAILEEQQRCGDYRMVHALEKAEAISVIFSENDPAFTNVNTPEELYKIGNKQKPVIYAVSGYKNSGKTTLITKLVPILTECGYKVAVIKHDGHDFVPDVPGTDSFRHREAGAYGTAVYSGQRFLVTMEWGEKTPDEKLLMKAFPDADIILIEGLKGSSYPKVMCSYPETVPDPEKIAEMILRHDQTIHLDN